MRQEQKYRAGLIDRIYARFPGCCIIPNDPRNRQGIPDLLILHHSRWGMLEVKASAHAEVQPNQPYWVDHYNAMSFAAFIFPENEEEVLDALERSLCVEW